MEMFHYRATESVMQHVVFDGGDDFHAAREKLEGAGIHWLEPARVDQRHRNAFFFQFLGRFFRDLEHVAESKDRDVAAVLYPFGLANLEEFWFRFDVRASAGTARIANRNRTRIVIRHRPK